MSYDRKAFSAEPQTAAAIMGKRWEDLIDAAASATEEDSRDLTPVSALTHRSFQFMLTVTGPTVPTILAPCQQPDLSPTLCCFALSVIHCFTIAEYIDPAAGHGFHMPSQGLSDSSPTFPYPVQIYCAACRKLSVLRDSYACSECICGLCQECVDVLVSEHTRGRAPRCPRCNAIGGKFKPFQLDIR
jgi:hypothetical protein